MAVDAMQEDKENSEGRMRAGILGADLRAPRWRLSSTRMRSQHHRGEQDSVSFAIQSSAALRRGVDLKNFPTLIKGWGLTW